MTGLQALGVVLMTAGAIFSVLAAWGVLDFPTSLTRMHAATKPASLGLSTLALGGGAAVGSWPLIGVGVLASGFLFLTAPIAGHLLGRAAYLTGPNALVHDELAGVRPEDLPPPRPPARWSVLKRMVGLTGVWVLLWGDVSGGTVLAGLAVATGVELSRTGFADVGMLRPWYLLRFLVTYLGLLIKANLRVAWEVITPSNEQIREGIVAVQLSTRSLPAALLVANSVSFSPGTLTIELGGDPMVLYVHVLHFTTAEEIRSEVWRLERLVTRAMAGQAG